MLQFFKKQEDMFTNADLLQHSFFAAKDTPHGKKIFTSFLTLLDFIEYYKSLPPHEKHFNELIRKDFPFYEYYDLDISLSPSSDLSIYNNEVLFEWFDTIRSNFLRLHTPIGSHLLKPNWVILTASDHTKLSLHLINTNAIFTSTDVFKLYYSQFKTYYKSFCSDHPFTIDWCVSSNNRMMRIIDSTKINSNRILRLYTLYNEKVSYNQTFITNASNDTKLFEKWITTDMFFSPQPEIIKNKTNKTNNIIEHTKEGLDQLLSILDPSRFDSYQDWISIGMALKNKDENNLNLWKKWSSLSNKYNEEICDSTWSGFHTNFSNPLTIGTIHFFAKTDNPQKYKEFTYQHTTPNIDLPFTPHFTIKQKFIHESFYNYHFSKGCNVIALKSNMNTGKTHVMPSLFNSNQKIIVIYQRVSLNISIHEKWKQYGFELYSDIEDYIIRTDTHPRIIIQVDSLPRLNGKCDLLVLDEIESVHEHLCGSRMITNTSECWKTLSNYIRYTDKIIACDANLKDETVNILFDKKVITKVENSYKSFVGLKCKIYFFPEMVIAKIFELLKRNKNIVIPTNSKSRAKKIEKLIMKNYPQTKILRIDSEKGFTPKEEWGRYNVLIYTPTVTAGVSFEENHFHSLCGFFGRNSTSAEQSSQMLFRVRNLIDREMFIYTDTDCKVVSKPIDDLSLTQYIHNIIKTSHQSLHTEGIDIDRYNQKAKENTYFKLYRLYLKKNHLSFTYFRKYLTKILVNHGIKIEYSSNENDINIFNDKHIYIKDIINDVKQVSFEIKIEDIDDIVNATPINTDTYTKLIESRKEKTRHEMISMKRYMLTHTFDRPYDDKLELEWVKKNINYLCYRNFKVYSSLPKDKALEKCQDMITLTARNNMIENTKKKRMLRPEGYISSSDSEEGSEIESPYRRKRINNNIHSHIHYDKTYHRLYHCLQFVFRAGFSSLGDEGKIKIDYNALHRYCKENEEEMRVIFGSKIMKWKDELDGNEKKALSKFINQKLEAYLGIRITPTYKGSLRYEINRLFVL